MRVRFITQPFEDGFTMYDFLLRALQNPSFNRLDIAVAWAKRSGLSIVTDAIRDFRDRDGYIRLIVGISEGGATKQGLELAMSLADEAYIFHVPSSRTFHPKVYAAYGEGAAEVLVGSHNLTSGGANRNFEAGTLCELDINSQEDRHYLSEVVEGYVQRLIDDTGVCIRMSSDVLVKLLANPAYQIGDEDKPRVRPTVTNDQADVDSDSITTDNQPIVGNIFGRSKHRMRSIPSIAKATKPSDKEPKPGDTNSAPTSAHSGTTQSTSNASKTVARRWFKKMGKADAQRPGPRTNPTGHLTLTQNKFDIDHQTYFRREFFGKEAWYPVLNSNREQATVSFEVMIGGVSLGIQSLVVDHNPDFESGQGNRTTTLRWGDVMNDYLREHNLVDNYVTIEQTESIVYGLTIDQSHIGPFIK